MVTQNAHWYSIFVPKGKDCSGIHNVFPPLSKLLSIDVGMMKEVLQACGLLYTCGKISSPLLHAWSEFLVEYQVDAEITTFSINNKKRFFVHIGTRHKLHHPVMTPVKLWRSNSRAPSELQILEIKDAFAHAVVKMELTSAALEYKNDESSSSSNRDPDVTDGVADDAMSSMLDPIQFPLLNKLGVKTEDMNRLVQEILKLHENQDIIFMRGNNRAASLVALPSH
jgi:hypothetical protein